MKSKNEHWMELNRALEKNFKKSGMKDFTNEVKVSFMKCDDGDLSMIFKGIDNKYGLSLDGKFNEWHWELYLNKSGTWKIN